MRVCEFFTCLVVEKVFLQLLYVPNAQNVRIPPLDIIFHYFQAGVVQQQGWGESRTGRELQEKVP